MNSYVHAILTGLSARQKRDIRETDKAYITFQVNIFNVGYTILLEFSDDLPILSEEQYQSFYLETKDAIWCLDQIDKE